MASYEAAKEYLDKKEAAREGKLAENFATSG